jgi:betaine reductase
MPEEEFYGVLKICDAFDIVWLEEGFVRQARESLAAHRRLEESDLEKLGAGKLYSTIDAKVADGGALPLRLQDGKLAGCVMPGDKEDPSLSAAVLLENLACKATATMALRFLLADARLEAGSVEYILNGGEEAVGDRYQRGGGNLA